MPRQVRAAGPAAGRRSLPRGRSRNAAAVCLLGAGARAAPPSVPRTAMKTRGAGLGPVAASPASASASGHVAPPAAAATVPAGVRQLRSRQVPIPAAGPAAGPASGPASGPAAGPAGGSAGATAAPVRGRRRRSRSAASSRVSESTTCDGDSSAAGRTEWERTSTGVQSRASTRASRSARMTVVGRTRGLRKVAGRVQAPGRANRAGRNVRGRPLRCTMLAPCKPVAVKAAVQPTEEATEEVSCLGCQEMMLPSNVESHQSRCCLRFPCPLACHDNCQWGGAFSQAMEHILKAHRVVQCTTGPNAVINMKSWRRSPPNHWVTLQTCLGQNFLIVVQKSEKSRCPLFLGTVRLFGHQEDADRFEYRMTLKTQGNISRTFSYSTIVRALHDDSTAVSKGDCFVFDTSHAEIFSFEGNLAVEVSISVMKM